MNAKQDLERAFRHAKAVAAAVLVLLVFAYLASGLYSVKPEQHGVVKRFGRVLDDNIPPGIHYRWPWPFESVQRPRTTEVRSLEVRFWTTTAAEGNETSGSLLTGDENLVLASLLLQYTISQPKEYLNATADPEGLLGRTAESCAVSRFAELGVDEALTTGRQAIQQVLRQEIQAKAEAYGLGVRLLSIQLQNIEPPVAVAYAFKDVASAREDMHKMVQEAEGNRNRALPAARAEANRMILEAQAYAMVVEETALGDAQRFLSTWEEYRRAKSVTAHRLYMEAVEEILPRTRKLIANPRVEGRLPVESNASVHSEADAKAHGRALPPLPVVRSPNGEAGNDAFVGSSGAGLGPDR